MIRKKESKAKKISQRETKRNSKLQQEQNDSADEEYLYNEEEGTYLKEEEIGGDEIDLDEDEFDER